MDTRLIVTRTLPNGTIAKVRPFHISMEGLESATICRDEEDYDVMVKNIFLCSRRCNVIVIIYAVVSNHAHIAILGTETKQVNLYADNLKKVQSMWLHRKYGDKNLLLSKKVDISELDTLQYARNALAYIPRNALDNGALNISEYKWTGFRGMFSNGKAGIDAIPVREMTTRAIEKILHTGDSLKSVGWMLNKNGEIEPGSACDWKYLEMIFNNDQAFFLRLIGSVNVADMNYQLSLAKSSRMTDEDFLKTADRYSQEWYRKDTHELSLGDKAKFIGYLGKKVYLSVPQVARCLNMKREDVSSILGHRR